MQRHPARIEPPPPFRIRLDLKVWREPSDAGEHAIEPRPRSLLENEQFRILLHLNYPLFPLFVHDISFPRRPPIFHDFLISRKNSNTIVGIKCDTHFRIWDRKSRNKQERRSEKLLNVTLRRNGLFTQSRPNSWNQRFNFEIVRENFLPWKTWNMLQQSAGLSATPGKIFEKISWSSREGERIPFEIYVFFLRGQITSLSRSRKFLVENVSVISKAREHRRFCLTSAPRILRRDHPTWIAV